MGSISSRTDTSTVVVPEFVLDDRGLRRDCAVQVRGDIIEAVIPAADAPRDALRLPRKALLPGFANVHSHAFQRALRGSVERVAPTGTRDDFWSWRESMYRLVDHLDPMTIHDISRNCYREMREAGYTAVGEFHYVHHLENRVAYDDPNIMAKAVCAAAEAEGLRIVLLLTAYERGGYRRSLTRSQERFADESAKLFLYRLDELVAWADNRPLVTVGVAAHSTRACSRTWLEAIADRCRGRMPFHVHAAEQPREIEECIAEHGLRPIELLEAVGLLGPRTTIIHGTHLAATEIDLLAAANATVCVCPTTEANLGDGYAPTEALVRAGVKLAIGSDSNARLDPLEEARELELIARRSSMRRNVLVRPGEQTPNGVLFDSLWRFGARSLGLPEPRLAPGSPADLALVDLDASCFVGILSDDFASALLFSGSSSAIKPFAIAGVRK